MFVPGLLSPSFNLTSHPSHRSTPAEKVSTPANAGSRHLQRLDEVRSSFSSSSFGSSFFVLPAIVLPFPAPSGGDAVPGDGGKGSEHQAAGGLLPGGLHLPAGHALHPRPEGPRLQPAHLGGSASSRCSGAFHRRVETLPVCGCVSLCCVCSPV